MRLFLSVCRACSTWVDQLIHPHARRCPAERARHHAFLARQSIASAAVLVGAPFWLMAVGAPTPTQGLLYFIAQTPLVSAVVLARRGNLLAAQALSVAGTLAAAIAMVAIGHSITLLAAMLVAVAILESVGAPRLAPLLLIGVGAATAAASAAEAPLAIMSVPAPEAGVPMAALILYAAAIVVETRRSDALGRMRDSRKEADMDLLRAMATGLILRLDARGHVVAMDGNPGAAGGLTPEAMMGAALFERIHIADRPEFLKRLSEARVGAGARDPDATWRLKLDVGNKTPDAGARFRVFEARLPQAARRRGEDETQICVLRDATAESEAEAALIEATRGRIEAEAERSRFLAAAGHELRTPLNAIIGFSEILSNPGLEPQHAAQRREYAELVNLSGQHLLAVVDRMLDLSKIEGGAMTIATERFAMPMLVEQCRRMLQLQAERGGVSILCDPPCGIEEIVADRRACGQIVINLLANAVKFTPSGGTVRVRLMRDGHDLLMKFIDTGVGVGAADLARLGQPFFQAHTARQAAAGAGTGLGLSVVRGLVGLHGGAITIESGLRQGTTVTVRLPIDGPPPSSVGAAKIETIVRHGPAYEAATKQETVKKIA